MITHNNKNICNNPTFILFLLGIYDSKKWKIQTRTIELQIQIQNWAANRLLKSEHLEPQDILKTLEFLPDQTSKRRFNLQYVTYEQVEKEPKDLCLDCSAGYDNISVQHEKSVYENLGSPLTHIINSSISENLFSIQLKMGKISPIPKIRWSTYIWWLLSNLSFTIVLKGIWTTNCQTIMCIFRDTLYLKRYYGWLVFENRIQKILFYWKFQRIFYMQYQKENLLYRFTAIIQKLLIQFKTMQLFKNSRKLAFQQ